MMITIIEISIVFWISFIFNLIPFFGPSNLFIAFTAALSAPMASPYFLGFLVALGAAVAKCVHYMVTFFISKQLSEKRQEKINKKTKKVKKWAFLILFITAASPIPDEPVVIPLGLMRYNPIKFFSSFFFGKLLITVGGAVMGKWTEDLFSGWISGEIMIVASIILTIIITVMLFKIDLTHLPNKLFRRENKLRVKSEDK